MKLSQKFLIPLVLLLMLAVFLTGAFAYFQTYDSLRDQVLNNMNQSVELLDEVSVNWFNARFEHVEALSSNDVVIKSVGKSFISKASRKVIAKRMREAVAEHKYFHGQYLFDDSRNLLASSDLLAENAAIPKEFYNFYDEAWESLEEPKQIYQKSVWLKGELHYLVAIRVFSVKNALSAAKLQEGMVIIDLDVDDLKDAYFENKESKNGRLTKLMHLEDEKAQAEYSEVFEQIKSESNDGAKNQKIFTLSNAGIIFVSRQMEDYPFIISSFVENKAITKPAYIILLKIALIGISIITLVAVLITFLVKWTLRPITKLLEVTGYVANTNDYSQRVEKLSDDELGSMVENFNTMLDTVEQRDEELTKSKDNLEKSAVELVAAKELAEKANRTKSDFLANMSHELRTPLNSILGMVQLVDTDELDEELQDTFDMVTKSSMALLAIVDDILDLSKIEAGEIELEALPFDAIEAAHHVVNSLQPMATKKRLELSITENVKSAYIVSDSLRFSRILMNLISNGLRYTEEGEVKVDINIKKLKKERIKMRCEVIDTGIGIPENKMDKVFNKFTQADAGTTRRFGGTGLGLAITKELLTLMQGEIGVESEVGVGSTFWFEVEFDVVDKIIESKETQAKKKTSKEEAKLSDISVLMAEDHLMNQKFMRKLFASLKIEDYTIVENGKDAVKQIEMYDHDLVLMDCHMPVMNGYDATVAIRKLNDEKKNKIPIIAMTANAMPEDEARCLDVGMDDYLPKPLDIESFKACLLKWIKA